MHSRNSVFSLLYMLSVCLCLIICVCWFRICVHLCVLQYWGSLNGPKIHHQGICMCWTETPWIIITQLNVSVLCYYKTGLSQKGVTSPGTHKSFSQQDTDIDHDDSVSPPNSIKYPFLFLSAFVFTFSFTTWCFYVIIFHSHSDTFFSCIHIHVLHNSISTVLF